MVAEPALSPVARFFNIDLGNDSVWVSFGKLSSVPHPAQKSIASSFALPQ